MPTIPYTPDYRLVTCQTCGRQSLYDVNHLPIDNRGRIVLINCKREQKAVKRG